jgi:hypothetical protein
VSRRDNCHDIALAESSFQLFKRERIRRKIYSSRELARQDIFDYIEMLYNPVRRHSHAGNLSSVNTNGNTFLRLQTVYKRLVDSGGSSSAPLST